MAKGKSKKSRVGPGGVILALAFTLALAAGVIYGVYFVSSDRPIPASMTAAAEPVARQVSLFTPGEPQVGQAPAPAQAPEAGEAVSDDGYAYDEIVAQEDGYLIATIHGKRYRGMIVVIDDPLRVTLGKCPVFGEAYHGRTVAQMAEEYGAVMAINGGGFSDPNGVGLGASPTGNVVYQGQLLTGYTSPTVGMDAQGRLHVGELSGYDCLDLGLQWAISYGPTLIQNGVIRDGLDTSIEEPRTVVGQRADGKIIFLLIQGRQASALGVTCYDLARIAAEYGAVNAGNLDGGASSDLWYQGEYITTRNASGWPRPIPTAVLVMPSAG